MLLSAGKDHLTSSRNGKKVDFYVARYPEHFAATMAMIGKLSNLNN